MSQEDSFVKIKKKKKQSKKLLPKNVFEIVGETGEVVERVDGNTPKKTVEQTKQTEPKPTFSERTTKRRVNIQRLYTFLSYKLFIFLRDENGMR